MKKLIIQVYKQGDNWIWSHLPDSRGLADQEQLPYWVKTKKDIKTFVESRIISHQGYVSDFIIKEIK